MSSKRKVFAAVAATTVAPTSQLEYETAEQIAARLQVKSSTVYGWVRRETNALPARRITNKIMRFVWAEVRAWVEAGGTLRRRKAA